MPTTAAVVGAVAAVGGTAMAASQMGKRPDQMNYGDTMDSILKAQIKHAPEVYSSEAQFQPQYAALNERILQQMLLGSPGGSHEETYSTIEHVPDRYEVDPTAARSPWGGQPRMRLIPGFDRPVYHSRTVQDPAQRGYLDLIENDVQPAADRIAAQGARSQRESDIRDVRELGPEAMAAIEASDPQSAELLKTLTAQAQGDLAAGSSLAPDEEREVQQAIRSAQAARGMGFGPSDVFTEAMGLGQAGIARKLQRQDEAARVLGLRQAKFGDPFLQILGRSSGSTALGDQFVGRAGSIQAGAGPRLFNPESPMGFDTAMTNYNAAQANYISGRNNFGAAMGGSMSMLGNLAGAYIRRPSTAAAQSFGGGGISTGPYDAIGYGSD